MREDRELASGTVTPRRGLYPDGATSWSAAGFGHASLDLARTTVEGGVRFTATGLRAEDSAFGVIDLGPSAWVGSAGLSHAVASHVRLYAQVSQSFRAPNIDDVSTLGSFDFGVEVPSPALEPERGLDVEGGVKARTSRAAAALAIYRLSLSNLIDRVRATFDGSDLYEGQAVYRRQNVGEAYVRGVEAEAQLEPATGWIIHGHVTSTFGQQTTTAQPMRRIPPLHGLLAVRWAAGRGFVEAAARGAASQRRLAPGDRADHRMNPDGTPAWATLDVRASLAVGRGVALTGAIENVTDEGYRIHGSGIDEPGRVAWVGITLKL
jgi:iron complex outermembrane receptor protein/hemoglobin/transferrin/lactoferrin receptor protein